MPSHAQRSILHRAVLLLFGLLLMSAHAESAESRLISKAYWLDETGTATLDDARRATFTAYEGVLSKGYTTAALWLKLRIAGSDETGLVVEPPFIGRIEMHDVTDGAPRAPPLVSGFEAPLGADNHIGLNNGFVIPGSTEPREILLRIVTPTTLVADVHALPLDRAEHRSDVAVAVLAVYFAFLLAFCLWGLLNLMIRREAIYGFFALRQFYSLLHVFMFFGLLKFVFGDLLGPESRIFAYCLVTVTVIGVIGHFDLRLLSEFGAARGLRKLFRFILVLPCLSLGLLLLGRPSTALWMNAIVVNAALVVLLLLALSTREVTERPHGRMAVRVVRYGYLVMTVLVYLPVLMHQNIIRSSLPVINLLFLHAVVSTVILSAVLTIRARQRDIAAQQALLQFQIKERELAAESRRRLEKERFLSMLTHELRNPLALIRLVTNPASPSGKAVEKATLDMARVLERVELSEKFDQADQQLEKTCVSLDTLIADLAAEPGLAGRLEVAMPKAQTLTTDETLLRSILRNLLENAEKYSPPDSMIRLLAGTGFQDGAEGITFRIVNEVGEAGPPEAEKLFTKYYRSKRAHRQPGSGLGLYLVAAWVKALGGGIGYGHDARAGGGGTVTFSLWVPR